MYMDNIITHLAVRSVYKYFQTKYKQITYWCVQYIFHIPYVNNEFN